MSEREEYLDKLLRDMETANLEEPESQEEFLENYDKDLSGSDENDFLSEFEKSLEEDSDFDDGSFDDSDFDLDAELGIERDETPDDFMSDINGIVNNVNNGVSQEEDTLDAGDLSFEDSFQGLGEENPVLDEIGNEFAVNDADFMVNTMEDASDADAGNPAQELMDMISSISEDALEEDVNISEEPQADRNIAVSDLDTMAQELAKEIEGLNLEEEEKPAKKKKKEKAEDTEEIKEEKKEKKGFLQRLSSFFFGEEEAPAEGSSSELDELGNISGENLEILQELEENKGPTKAEIKAQKAKENKEKKEQKAKERAEKKAQKAQEKAARPKKEKPQEPVEKLKPLPKKPAVLIILFGLSIVVLVALLSSVMGYNVSLAQAKEYYAKGDYVEAYGCFSEDEVKKADKEFYDQIRLTAYLQQQINIYRTYQKQKMYQEALGALIGSIGRYDRFLEEAQAAKIGNEYKSMYQTIKKALKKNYGMSVKAARKLYAIGDRVEFTHAVEQEIEKLGLNVE